MKAPFPYHGGKSRWASKILARLEPCDVYVEPFAGSLAVLLASEPHKREVVCDTSGHIANFWRALRDYPDEVAYWADYPSYHHDLTARHRWLIEWAAANAHRLSEDADWCDPKAAGWWCWGISNWIATSAWCNYICKDGLPKKSIPFTTASPGVSVNRINVPDGIPMTRYPIGGRGVTAQRIQLPGAIGTGDRLMGWFHQLAQRLSKVIVFNRPWTSAVTPTILMQTAASPKNIKSAVLLDPPYRGSSDIYGVGSDAAVASYEWAVANGDKLRIAYCCGVGDFPLPEGWTDGGEQGLMSKGGKDTVMFSPACEVRDG